jgi:glutathione peroxidase
MPGANGDVKWNYEKFLVGRDGLPMKRYGAPFDTKAIAADIQALLSAEGMGAGAGAGAAGQ